VVAGEHVVQRLAIAAAAAAAARARHRRLMRCDLRSWQAGCVTRRSLLCNMAPCYDAVP
jgi:hypothetical protein